MRGKRFLVTAEILMREEAVREVVARKGPDIPPLARVFVVSRKAMPVRLGS